MKRVVDIRIGEVKAEQGEAILESKAIGSCIAIAAYDGVKKIGALAHVMLPGSAPPRKQTVGGTKYAANAIDAIVSQMVRLGSKNGDIEVVLVGGGNVLNREDDTICEDNIKSTLRLLVKKGLKVRAQAVGGTSRRSVSLDVERGIVYYSEGDGGEIELWRVRKSTE